MNFSLIHKSSSFTFLLQSKDIKEVEVISYFKRNYTTTTEVYDSEGVGGLRILH